MATKSTWRRPKRTPTKRSLEDTPTQDPQLDIIATEEEDEEEEMEASSVSKGAGDTVESAVDENDSEENTGALLENSENCRRFSSRTRRKTDFLNMGGKNSDDDDKAEKRKKRKRVPSIVRKLSFQPHDESPKSLSITHTLASTEDSNMISGRSVKTISEQGQKEVSTPLNKDTGSRDESTSTDNYTPPPFSSPTPTSATTDITEEEEEKDSPSYPVGSIIWGKLPGYEWWPGIIISHSQGRNKAEEKEAPGSEGGGISSSGVGCQVWVKWCGESNLSQISTEKVAPFGSFTDHFNPSSLKGIYKKGIFIAIKEAAKRCSYEFTSKHEDKTLRWVISDSAPEPTLIAGVRREESEGGEVAGEGSGGVEDAASVVTSGPEDTKSFKRRSRKKLVGGREKGSCLLTSLEQEMLQWARKGFLPSGPAGFEPTSEQSVEIQVLPVQQQQQQSGGSKKAGESEKTKGETGSREEDEEPPKKKSKVMIVQVKKKVHFNEVHEGKVKIADICIGCGSKEIIAEHPLFEGSFCKECKESFLECAYLFDEDGTQMYCCVCSAGDEVFICDTENCSKVYCGPCIEKLCGKEELEEVKAADGWKCYMCLPEKQSIGLLTRRSDWDCRVQELFKNDNEQSYPIPTYPPILPESRTPIRVLGLFDGIATGLLVLKELGIEIEAYVASEVDEDAIKVSRVWHNEICHIGDICRLTDKEVEKMGPFDLVMGGSPCNDLSVVNPLRRGIYEGTGRLFFDFYRILAHAKLYNKSDRPLFWLYENVVSMRAEDKQTISRFLQCNPIVVDAKEISATHRARYFWGNIPGMNRAITPLPGDRLTLQDCLEPNCSRRAQFLKLRTITTKMNSIKQTKKAIYPVRMGSLLDGPEEKEETPNEEEMQGDVLWCTEMERLFGFPDHYTDVANLGRSGRQRLLGKAWSAPVLRHILSPLKDYFKSNTNLTRKTPSSRNPRDL